MYLISVQSSTTPKPKMYFTVDPDAITAFCLDHGSPEVCISVTVVDKLPS